MNRMMNLLVIAREGEDREAIAKKYDLLHVESRKLSELVVSLAGEMRKKDIEQAQNMADNESLPQSERDIHTFIASNLNSMSDADYFYHITETGRNYMLSNRNPDGVYMFPRCYQERFEKTGEEAPLSAPFALKDGGQSYVSKIDDIDWSEMHGSHRDVYELAWELCVEGKKPDNIREQGIVDRMSNREEYFSSFADKEEYVRHSTSFFTYAVATTEQCFVPTDGEEKEWVCGFYDRFIKPNLGKDITLSLYDISVPE